MHKHVLLRAKIVQDIVKEHYQPERQDRCKLWVYRNMVYPKYPMSERTFFYYLSLNTDNIKPKIENKNQLRFPFYDDV